MNLDKQSIVAIALGVLALIGWYVFGPKMLPPAPVPAKPEIVRETPARPTETAPKTPVAVTPARPKLPALAPVALTGPLTDFVFAPSTGTLERVTLRDYLDADHRKPIAITNEYPELAGAAAEFGAFGIRGARGELTVLRVVENRKIGDREYRLVRQMSGATPGTEFLLEETWRVADGRGLTCDLRIVNPYNAEIRIPGMIVSAGDLPSWDRLSGDRRSSSQETHSFDYCTEEGKVKSVSTDAKPGKLADLNMLPVRWFGVSNRFFAMLLKSDTPLALAVDRVEDPGHPGHYVATIGGELASFVLAPEAAREIRLDYFLGPKQPAPLRAFDDQAAKVMRLGWFPIDFLAYIMLAMLNWIHGFAGSFGWSIILLTLLVRLIFFPVTMKANASMRDMQALGPEVKAIRDRYKSEPMVAQSKISELYKARGVNPLSGCLPMLIQIPVFIALYYALGSAVELRQQSFWWIHDLAQPDTVATVFGIGIHPLIIIWTGLMMVQQKLTPTAMEPMQAKMMLAMPLVMLFILYDLPSGLTLYWAVSQIFSIVQMYYQQHAKKREERSNRNEASENAEKKPKIVRS